MMHYIFVGEIVRAWQHELDELYEQARQERLAAEARKSGRKMRRSRQWTRLVARMPAAAKRVAVEEPA